MEWWAGEGTPIAGISALQGFWSTSGITLFDSSTTAGSALDNATLPVMAAMGGKLDPTLSYQLVNASDSGVLETQAASTAPGAGLAVGPYTGITGPQQRWRFLAQGANPEVNSAVYPTAMDHRGDGYFQVVNMNQKSGVNGLDTNGATASGSAVVQDPETVDALSNTGTNANQEWDVLPEGNCGDVPANCTAPPTVTNGDGDYYMIINKATGMVLADAGGQIQQQTPAAPSNGDWAVPANKGQLWRIVPADITAATVDTTVGASVAGTLSLTIGASPTFGTFTPAVDATYNTSTTAGVTSTAASATLSVSDASAVSPGHLVNGIYSLSEPVQLKAASAGGAGSAFAPLGASPLAILSYSQPVSNDAVTISLQQHISATEPLRTGAYSKTLTFTLSSSTL
jgi:hypothetical protein